MDSFGGAKETIPVSISPEQPTNSNLTHTEFEFGNNGKNDNKRRNDLGTNGTEKSQEDMLHPDSVSAHAKEKEWIEVQRKGKKKIGPDHKKPNLKITATKPSTAGLTSRVSKSNTVSVGLVGRSMSNRASLHSRDAKKVDNLFPTPATSTPAPLHPHKRRRPPSL
ncbi:hypothetical protein PIB30_101265 [Stylosanthes scabra]|uniref:Uncharacterized protein n=1 Tax=Stylosanthes scabra TaxID=79078 RepID=A0ABU6UZX8_9FABA|nr:hypothetical protein [Stylosanthes scabra]